MLVQISAPHFCAGFDMDNGNIAPIIKYMKSWDLFTIITYCEAKQWEVWVGD